MYQDGIDVKALEDNFEKYGPTPRAVYYNSLDKNDECPKRKGALLAKGTVEYL